MAHRRFLRPVFLLAPLTLAVPIGACSSKAGVTGPPDADLTILFVGNSLTYTNNLPGIVAHLVGTYGNVESVHVESVAHPNYGLEDHWTGSAARAHIAQGGWDFVVIQQGPSATEGRPSLIEYAGRFQEEVARAGGTLAVYMVWPAQVRFFDFDGVSDSHTVAAEQAGAWLFPAGEAWRAAWARDPDLALYGSDGFHPSLMGSYLAALVMFERLTGIAPTSLPPGILAPGGTVELPLDTSRHLHEAAAEANRVFGIGADKRNEPAPTGAP